jgi:hypothetical protein
MKASDLLASHVTGPGGDRVGVVIDVRARIEDRGRLILEGLVLGRRPLRLFGYERRAERGPFLLERFESFLHRGTKFANMDQLEISETGQVRLKVEWDALPHITEI